MSDVVCYTRINHRGELDFIREHNTQEVTIEGYPEFPYYLVGVVNYAGAGSVPAFVSIGERNIHGIVESYHLEGKEISFIDLATALK